MKITVEQKRQLLLNARPVRLHETREFAAGAIDIEHRTVTTCAMVPYSMNLNGWRILPEEIEAALDFYMAYSQAVGRDHKEITNSFPIRAWIDGSGAAWTKKVVADEQDWQNITSGVYRGTSWGGQAMLVVIPEELAAQLYIPPGDWLFDIEWWEDSYVNEPAVQEATFYNAAEGGDSLVSQLVGGAVKPRVRYPRAPMPAMNEGTAEQRNGLLAWLKDAFQSTFAALSGKPTSEEDTDMGMTPDEQKQVADLAETVNALSGKLDALLEAQGQKPEESTEPVDNQAAAPDLAAEIAKALEPLNKALADQAALIEALSKQEAPSARLREDSETANAPKPSVASLPHDDPARQAVTGRTL